MDALTVSKDQEGWYVRGNLCQLSNSLFRLPVELMIEAKKGIEHKRIWLETRRAAFEFSTPSKPKTILVDPNFDILKIQKMPPFLKEFWDAYPKLVVIYGTLAEAEANKSAADHFTKEYLGLGDKIIRADVDVNEADLRTRCLVLFGRPETSKIAQRFKDNFPIELKGNTFIWQGVTYDQPTQGVAQIVEKPHDPQGLMIMYAGLSGESIQKFCDLYLYDDNASYVIFDRDKRLVAGDWEEVDSNLVWKYEEHPVHKKR